MLNVYSDNAPSTGICESISGSPRDTGGDSGRGHGEGNTPDRSTTGEVHRCRHSRAWDGSGCTLVPLTAQDLQRHLFKGELVENIHAAVRAHCISCGECCTPLNFVARPFLHSRPSRRHGSCSSASRCRRCGIVRLNIFISSTSQRLEH